MLCEIFVPIGSGVSFLCMRDFTHHSCLLGYFLGSSSYPCQDAHTDLDKKYIAQRGSTQGCAFWGSQTIICKR